jgi:hypothetical protein
MKRQRRKIRKPRLKRPDDLPVMGEGNWWQNLQIVFYHHRFLFSTFRRAQGWTKIAIFIFLALIFYDVTDATLSATHAILTPGPAMAFAPGLDLAPGQLAGQLLFEGAWDQMQRLYKGEFGIRAATAQVALFVAAPIAATAIVMALGEDEEPVTIFRKPWALGSFIIVFLLSGGGSMFGQLFIVLVDSGEIILRGVTSRLSVNQAISAARGALSINSSIASSVAECQKFVGQEQNQCIFEASSSGLGIIANVKEASLSGGAGVGGSLSVPASAPWADAKAEQLAEVARNILDPNETLSQAAFSTFMSFASPLVETYMAIIANTLLTVFDIAYALFVSFYGFTLPLASVSALLSPVARSGLIAWGLLLFQAWWFRALYLMGAWAMSRLLTSSSAQDFTSSLWFSVIMVIALPWMIKKLVSGAGNAIYGGILAAGGNTAKSTAETAAAVGVGIASGGSTAAAAPAAAGAARAAADVSKPPRVAID